MAVIPSAVALSVEGRTGPGLTLGGLAFQNIEKVELDFMKSVGRIEYNLAQGMDMTIVFDLSTTTTLTDAITAFVHQFTIAGT